MLDQNYIIREAEESEKAAVVSFVNEHYIPETVIMNAYLNKNKNKITPNDRKEILEKMKENVYKSACLVAINRSDKTIVGTVILLPVASANVDTEEKQKSTKSLSLMQKFDQYLLEILKEVQLFEKYSKRKKLANMRYLATHKNHRGKGLAKALARESIELARKQGINLIYSFYTLPGSKKSAEGAGFTKVADYDLYTARDENGDAIFADLGPYNVTSIMALALD